MIIKTWFFIILTQNNHLWKISHFLLFFENSYFQFFFLKNLYFQENEEICQTRKFAIFFDKSKQKHSSNEKKTAPHISKSFGGFISLKHARRLGISSKNWEQLQISSKLRNEPWGFLLIFCLMDQSRTCVHVRRCISNQNL